jgi:hypothetical protein
VNRIEASPEKANIHRKCSWSEPLGSWFRGSLASLGSENLLLRHFFLALLVYSM